MVRCHIRTQDTNKWRGTILAALRPFGNTVGALREVYKCFQDDLHIIAAVQPLLL